MKKVDFSVFMDRHAAHAARDDRKKADSMDCHDFASAKSRNDRNLFFQQDSRVCKQRPKFNKQAKDSKICDEKAGLRCLLRGISLDGYRTSKRQAPCFIAQSRIHQRSKNGIND